MEWAICELLKYLKGSVGIASSTLQELGSWRWKRDEKSWKIVNHKQVVYFKWLNDLSPPLSPPFTFDQVGCDVSSPEDVREMFHNLRNDVSVMSIGCHKILLPSLQHLPSGRIGAHILEAMFSNKEVGSFSGCNWLVLHSLSLHPLLILHPFIFSLLPLLSHMHFFFQLSKFRSVWVSNYANHSTVRSHMKPLKSTKD